jgi:hypothetical protein
MLVAGTISVADIARRLGLSRQVFYPSLEIRRCIGNAAETEKDLGRT